MKKDWMWILLLMALGGLFYGGVFYAGMRYERWRYDQIRLWPGPEGPTIFLDGDGCVGISSKPDCSGLAPMHVLEVLDGE